MSETLLSIKNLSTSFETESGLINVLNDVSFDIPKGKTIGIVGESGCGKSVTSLSIMRLLPRPIGMIDCGEIIFDGIDLTKIPIDEMKKIRGKKISMIFQEPMTALNPVHKIGRQLGECFRLHFPQMSEHEIIKESIQLLKDVGIPLPERRINEYPHQLSGGMRQRVVIAIALACRPELIIADEPTTALDVTIQAQILGLLKGLQDKYKMSVMFITHDLGVIAQICDEVVVMYCGQVVEKGDCFEIFKNPKHPYTKGLLSSIPRLDQTPKTHLLTIEGMVADLNALPTGCRFQNRCPYVEESCTNHQIEMDSDFIRCHRWKELQ